MIILGLTGSIGMGKSTTASLFAEQGVPVWDADACVHELYEKGPVVEAIRKDFPSAVINGRVDRNALKSIIINDATALKKIEQIVHPFVAEDRKRFLTESTAPIVLLDIPLLFETGTEESVDKVVVVSVSPGVQRARVLARGTMSGEQFSVILKKQMPDSEKRARADYEIDTSTFEIARHQVQVILKELGYERDRS